MNWLDIVIVVVMLLASLAGWRVGILRAAATLAGLWGGLYLASEYHTSATAFLAQFIDHKDLATIGGYAIVFIATMVAAFGVGALLRRILRWIFLGWVDALAGASLAFLLSIGIWLALLVPLQDAAMFDLGDAIDSSVLGSLLVNAASPIDALLPESLNEVRRLLSLS